MEILNVLKQEEVIVNYDQIVEDKKIGKDY